MRDYLLSRLGERSTWAGLLAVLGAFGIWEATPDQASAITALALAIMGGFSALAPDTLSRPSGRVREPDSGDVRRDSVGDAPESRPVPRDVDLGGGFQHPDER
jgi:hypothetical protein